MRNLAHSLIPSPTPEEVDQLKEYFIFYQEVEPIIQPEAEKILENHPFWGPLLKTIPREVMNSQNNASRELQRDAIFNNNWEPYILNMIEEGIRYAQMGLDFRGWYEIVNLIRRLIAPAMRAIYETDKPRVIRIANGMNVLLDIAMGVIGEAYLFEKRRLVEEEKQKQQELSKEIEQFVYIASHDLQEPLNTIITFSSLLQGEHGHELSEEAHDLLKRIENSSNRMRELITDLLEYSRVGKKDPMQHVSFNKIVQEVIADMKATIDGACATIEVGSLPDLTVHPLSIKMLFQNLISNAIKFREKDKRSEIKIRSEHSDGSYKFAVQDNGIGIEQKQHDKIFEMFRRLHPYSVYEGTGIGLAHCNKIVQLHGGKIWVESSQGKGSTFYFTLPVNKTTDEKKT